MEIKTKFQMRDTLKDTITGYVGMAVAITYYDTGCTHYSLQAPMDKDKKVPDWENFDESRLVLKKKAPVQKVVPTSGPPRHKPEKW